MAIPAPSSGNTINATIVVTADLLLTQDHPPKTRDSLIERRLDCSAHVPAVVISNDSAERGTFGRCLA